MKKIVLIVDDDPTARLFINKLCKSLGVSVWMRPMWIKAMELLSAISIDLVISEFNMPG